AFASLPDISDRADRLDPGALGAELAGGHGYLGFARNGWMETLGVDMTTGRPEQVIVLPRQSYKPLASGLATGGFVLCLLFKLYWLSLLLLALTIVSLLAWSRGMGATDDMDDLAAGRGLYQPPHWETERPPSWWALVFACAGDATLFASLLFGALFLWLVAPGWPPAIAAAPALAPALLAAMMIVAATMAGRRAVSGLQKDASPLAWLLVAGGTQLLAMAAFLVMAVQVPEPTAHAHQATLFVILVYAGIRTAIGALFALHGLMRWQGGYLSARRSLDLRIARLWHDYAAVTGL